MKAPLIGLTTYNDANKNGFPIASLMHMYIAALIDAGGIPVMVPSLLSDSARRSLLGRLDGLLLTGGGDIAIEIFGGEFSAHVQGVDPERDTTEFALLREAAEIGKPFLGICRGLQVVNVALGGTLYTHLPDQYAGAIRHDYNNVTQRRLLAHDALVDDGSQLAGILGEKKFGVNSLHHQGVKVVSQVLRPAVYAPDGLIEAVELPDHPFGLAVQWHPEWLTDQPISRRLFSAFVEAANQV